MILLRQLRSFWLSSTIVLALFMMTATVSVRAQVAQDTDVKLHKFQPKVQPEQAAPTAAVQRPGPAGVNATAAQQDGGRQTRTQKSLKKKTAQSHKTAS